MQALRTFALDPFNKFRQEYHDFKVALKNINYAKNQNNLVSDQINSKDITQSILEFCVTENLTYFTRKYLKSLLLSGQFKMTLPDKPNSRNQKYITR